MPASNYPPSVTGGERQVAGEPDLRDRRCPDPVAHGRAANKAQAECVTCRVVEHGEKKMEPCIGCKTPIDYFSCSPGYCRLCAHDPCWQPVPDEDVPERKAGRLILGRDAGGSRHFLDGEPVHCGTGLEMQVPGGKWVAVRYEASLARGDIRVSLHASPWAAPRKHEAPAGAWCNRCDGKAWGECEPDWGPGVVVTELDVSFVTLRWPVRK